MWHNIPIEGYLNIILRSFAVYLFIVIAIRIFGKKELAQLSVTDLVFILLISNAVQNAMVGPDVSLQGGLIAALTLFVMNYILKRLLYNNQKLSYLVQGQSIMLIYNGRVLDDHLRKAEITVNELEAAVREHGVPDFKHVDLAVLEVDGNISIISDDFRKRSTVAIARKKHKLRGRLNKS